jgi:hypothetical protein
MLPLVDFEPTATGLPRSRCSNERSAAHPFLSPLRRAAARSTPEDHRHGLLVAHIHIVGCKLFAVPPTAYARDTHRSRPSSALDRRCTPRDPALGEMELAGIEAASGQAATSRACSPARSIRHGLGDATLVIGTATDALPTAERQFGITRVGAEVLESGADCATASATNVTARGPDLDLLAVIAKRMR